MLGEAARPAWANVAFAAIAGAIAVYGVFELARNHPQIISDSQEIPIERREHGRADGHPSTGSIRLTEAVSRVWPEPPVHDDDDVPGSR